MVGGATSEGRICVSPPVITEFSRCYGTNVQPWAWCYGMPQILAAVVLDNKEHTRNQMTLMVVMLHEEADLTLRINMPELIGMSCD